MEAARKCAEADMRAAEIAEKLREEREILECKMAEEKMMERVCKFFSIQKSRLYSAKYTLIYSA